MMCLNASESAGVRWAFKTGDPRGSHAARARLPKGGGGPKQVHRPA